MIEKIKDAVLNNQPLNINGYLSGRQPLGDTLVLVGSLSNQIKKMYKKNPIFSIETGVEIGLIINRLIPQASRTKKTPHSYLHFIEITIASIFNSEIPRVDSNEAPEIVRVEGHAALSEFSLSEIKKIAAELKNAHGDDLILICQAGSQEYKRFTQAQIDALSDVLKKNIPIKLFSTSSTKIFNLSTD